MRCYVCLVVPLLCLIVSRYGCQIRAFSAARLGTFSKRRLVVSNARHAPPHTTYLLGKTRHDDDDIVVAPSELLLKDVVCCVTGASRGIGKGIALELGQQGAIVYVTGTSLFQNATRQGSLEETAQQVTQLGGRGIPVLCDHANDTQVEALMRRIADENGRLDILINNAFQFPTMGGKALEFMMQRKFWQQGAAAWDPVHSVGLRSHYIASCYAMPLMLKARDDASVRQGRPPLIVMISSFGGLTYSFNVAYGVGKAGVDRLAKDMAVELTDEGIGVISLWPGVVRTERTEKALENGDWQKYVGLSMALAESPQFTGRAVVALATDDDPERLLKKKSGTYQVVAELATEYGFTDVDGSQPPSIRSLRFLLYNYAWDEAMRAKWSPSWIPDWRLPFWIMAQGRPPE